MAKGDIRISKLRNLPTTTSVTTLAAIDVTSGSNYPDGYAIISKDAPNHRLYILNRSSTDTPDNDQFVPSNVTGVVWERIMGTNIAQNDIRGSFNITTNPAEYPKGLASSAVNATQLGNGSGVGNTIKAGDGWYVINNNAGTDTIGPSPKTVLTNNAVLLALVDNATNSDSDWVILEATAGSDLAPNIASLRTLGTGAQQAAAGNDTRLSDARVPLTHAASHKHGGADEIATATPTANEIPKANGAGKLDAWITGASESAVGLIEIATQAESDTGTDDSRAITPLKLANNSRMPSQSENDALQGTSGTPSNTNRYVTNDDVRNTNARTPVGTALTSAQIWVGSAGNVAAAVSVTGDISISNTGVVSIPSTFITSKATVTPASGDYILVADVSDSNNLKKILISSLPAGSSALNTGQIFVGNGSNIATGVAMSGDVTIATNGVTTIANNAVTNAKLRLSTGLSVMGRSGSTSGQVEDIIATAEGQVLQVKAGILQWDTIAGGLASPLTTKGDIWVYGISNNRLPVGTDGQLLIADSAETLGLKWVSSSTITGAYLPLIGGTMTGNITFANNKGIYAIAGQTLNLGSELGDVKDYTTIIGSLDGSGGTGGNVIIGGKYIEMQTENGATGFFIGTNGSVVNEMNLYADSIEIEGSVTIKPDATSNIISFPTGKTGTVALLSDIVSASLPDQTGNSGKYLTTDGTTASWATVSGGGGSTTSIQKDEFVYVSGAQEFTLTHTPVAVVGVGIRPDGFLKATTDYTIVGTTLTIINNTLSADDEVYVVYHYDPLGVAFTGDYNDLFNTPIIPDQLSDLSEDSTHRTVTDSEKSTWNAKQSALVSGTSIKTINGNSLLGSGDLIISGGGGGATNLSSTLSSTTVTINSDTGADVVINAVDGTNAGVVTVAQKSTWDAKQDALVSATNIKTINGVSILGSGDLVVGGGVSDGDKGDITISSSGTVWTIDSGVISNTKLATDVKVGSLTTLTTLFGGAQADITTALTTVWNKVAVNVTTAKTTQILRNNAGVVDSGDDLTLDSGKLTVGNSSATASLFEPLLTSTNGNHGIRGITGVTISYKEFTSTFGTFNNINDVTGDNEVRRPVLEDFGGGKKRRTGAGPVGSTSATAVTIETITIPTDRLVIIETKVFANTTALTTSSAKKMIGVFKNISGTVTQISTTTDVSVKAEGSYDGTTTGIIDFLIVGTTVTIRFRGAAAVTSDVYSQTEISYI